MILKHIIKNLSHIKNNINVKDNINIKYGFSSIVYIYEFDSKKYAIKNINKKYYFKHLIGNRKLLIKILNNGIDIPKMSNKNIKKIYENEKKILQNIQKLKLKYTPKYYGSIDKYNILITEYIDGSTIKNYDTTFLLKVLQCIKYFHTKKIYLVDISLNNFILKDGKIFCIDFGDIKMNVNDKKILKKDLISFCYIPIDIFIYLLINKYKISIDKLIKKILKKNIHINLIIKNYKNIKNEHFKSFIKNIILYWIKKNVFNDNNNIKTISKGVKFNTKELKIISIIKSFSDLYKSDENITYDKYYRSLLKYISH